MKRSTEDPFDRAVTAALPSIRRAARKFTKDYDEAEELVQTTALNAFLGRDRFEPGSDFRSWIFCIYLNVSRDRFRRIRIRRKNARLILPLVPEISESFRGPLDLHDLIAGLRKLPKASRHTLLLATLGGEQYTSIADRLDVSVNTVKSRVSRSRTALLALMNGEDMPRVI